MKLMYLVAPVFSFLLILPGPALGQTQKRAPLPTQVSVTALMIGFVLHHQNFGITNQAFNWIAAHFGLINAAPNEVGIEQDEMPRAQIIVNELVQNHKLISSRMDTIMARLAPLPAGKLMRIVVAQDIPIPVRMLAEETLRTREVMPRLAQGRYAEIAQMNRIFQRIAGTRLGRVREIGARLFAFADPEQEVGLGKPTVHAAIAMRRGLVPLSTILNDWIRDTQILRRAKQAQKTDASKNFVLLDVQALITSLVEELRSVPSNEPEKAVAILHRLHGALDLFETLQFEDVENQSTATKAPRPNEQMQQAVQTRGADRFPLTGDWEIDVLLLGFEKDHALVNEAAKEDDSDSAHKLSKGDSLIRGKLIISRDRDAHAGDGYKLHEQIGKRRWTYRGTVILTEINGQHVFLLMNRNNVYRTDYWYAVTPDGQWYRLKKDDPNAKLEETTGPELKGAQTRTKTVVAKPLGRANR